ncbi:MAG TPA: ABC transporter substrate-binding protein [Thermomicrobiales bacterium]|nr:ABC transporter substrate-binding protein [Thermomicrobiales bacterium]
MKRGRQILTTIIAAAMMMTAFGGLTSGAAVAQGDRPVLRFAQNTSDITTLNPHLASSTPDRSIVDMVFNGLVRFKPGDASQFEPDIATAIPEPTMDGDKQVWTFTLRDDVKCQASEAAGTEAYTLTADDVVFSLQDTANPDTSATAGDYAGWTFAKVDDSTVTITLDEPVSPALFLPKVANYAGGYILCQKPFEALGPDKVATNPVGTGPFSFVSYTPQNSVVLTANDDFYRGAPKLGGVEVRFIADTTARELALQAGELDVINGLPEAQWVDRINGQDGFAADVFGVGEAIWINLNVEHEILKDPKVREAIILAINRENHVALQGAPVAEPIYSVVPASLVPGGLTEEEATAAGVNYEQNIERAKELLAEAGYADGFSLDLVASEQAAYRTQYEVLAEELRQIGITVNLEVVQHAAMHELIRQDANPITIYIAFRPTADTYLTSFFTTEGGTTNFSKFTVDDLVAQARAETDPDKQAELWRQANIEIEKNFAGYGLMFTNQVYARADKVDYGHELVMVPQLYPGIDELTTIGQ